MMIAAAPPPVSAIFDDTRVHSIHITISPEEYAKIDEGDRHPYVKADAEIDGEKIAGIGVRRKRATEREVGSPKTSYKLNFGKFSSEERFHGLKRLVINAALDDPTMIREKLAYDLFHEAGCPAPRAAH